MDLSVGDTPMDIDAWAHSFVDPNEPCHLMGDDEFQEVWGYWIAVTSSWVPEKRPARVCGYQIYSLLKLRSDQAPLALDTLPQTLEVQNGAFVTTMSQLGVTVTQAEIPNYLSRYRAQTEADLCRIWKYAYCE